MNEEIASDMSALEIFNDSYRNWLFRGLRDPAWKLETSLERAARRCEKPTKEYEKQITKEFKRHAHSYMVRVPEFTDELEWLALMQHHGAPTRLLDFTRSFWIGLYFACEAADDDCVVWAVDPNSLGRDGRDYNKILRENIVDGKHIDNYLYYNEPFFTNERLAIQKGTFVFSLNVQKQFHDLFIKNKKVHKKLIIKKTLFPGIRRLNDFNCTSRVLFPGIDGYARYFQNHDW